MESDAKQLKTKRKQSDAPSHSCKKPKIIPVPPTPKINFDTVCTELVPSLNALKAQKLTLKSQNALIKRSFFRRLSQSAAQSKIQLIWVKQQTDLYKRCFDAIIREVGEYTLDPIILSSYTSGLCWFDPVTAKWSKQAKVGSWKTPYSSWRYAAIDLRRTFAINGCLCYIITIKSDKCLVEPQPSANRVRLWPGVLVFRDEIYLFGGNFYLGNVTPLPHERKIKRSIESFQLPGSEKWNLLNCFMNEKRESFTPCEFEEKAYLASYPSCVIEVFSLRSRHFLPPINVSTPIAFQAITCVVNCTLVMISEFRIDKVDLRRETTDMKTESVAFDLGRGITPAVVMGPYMFWSCWGLCFRAKVDGDLTKIKKFSG